ncbi:ROK family transcriptional regulator [Pseudoalteromonas luteoviolacea]|uniref:ROK family transcriptional regulator n=1 Tax=Pseudoalteromonas luteoviolacea TaxID=43657 RepID=UPI001B35F581|nr:ROK family transcriptional regulator [Pseudoalteromonas luteoviolacea]MBQ4811687.1 ROK family transcriptional regulator [Pseudoalteromonas luteoviolacea]
MKGLNAKQNKAANLRLVLSQVVTLGPISRAEIARNTQLTKQTITNMVEDLLSVNLIEEVGIKRAEGAGKPSKMLCLNKRACHTLAVRISPDMFELGLYFLNGECLAKRTSHKQIAWSSDNIANEVQQLIRESNIEHPSILAMGLSLQTEQGDTLFQHQAGKKLQKELSQKLVMPVAIETTASACAAYQMLFGEAKTLHNFIYVHLGNKIEAAVVHDRQIMLGQNGLTGALGDIFVTPEINQSTGELGTLNDFASLVSLRHYIEKHDKQPLTSVKHLDPIKHSACQNWLAQATEPLRIAIHTLESILNTQTIILGGDLGEPCLDYLISQLRPFIPSIAQQGNRDIVRLIKAPNNNEVSMVGISTLPLHAALNDKNMQTLYTSPTYLQSKVQQLIYA